MQGQPPPLEVVPPITYGGKSRKRKRKRQRLKIQPPPPVSKDDKEEEDLRPTTLSKVLKSINDREDARIAKQNAEILKKTGGVNPYSLPNHELAKLGLCHPAYLDPTFDGKSFPNRY